MEVNNMENKMVSLKVDETMVSSILAKQIQAAIVQQLGSQDELIAQAVKVALSQKVNHEGKVDDYSSYNKYDFLEILAKSIREAAKAALQEWLAENSKKIRKAVLEELKTPSRQRSIATAYADAIKYSPTNKFNISCNIEFKERE
jgi:hypothetical protein